MRCDIIEIGNLKFQNVRFYTVHVKGRLRSEFSDFVTRMSVRCPAKLGELLQFIDEIGHKHRVQENYFRHERNAHALPPHYIHLCDDDSEEGSKFGLRLYCCKFTPQIVFLYNGDLKTAQLPDDCPAVSRHFNFALNVTRKIDAACKDEYLAFEGNDVLMDENFPIQL